jgi:multiple sugar transport system substrate-binding protein
MVFTKKSFLIAIILFSFACSFFKPNINPTQPTAMDTITPSPTETATATATPAPTEIHWFIGTSPNMAEVSAFVDKFNSEQKGKYVLVTEVYKSSIATETLFNQIGSGNAPDIISSIGNNDNLFLYKESWLDLTPLIESNRYDLSDFYPKAIQQYHDDVYGQIAMPFMLWPTVLWYNKTLFDQAGIPYPPHQWGGDYEGGRWTFDALRKIALRLTVDSAGNHPGESGFRTDQIAQYGLNLPFSSLPEPWAYFGNGSFLGEQNRISIPDAWRQAAHWYYDGMWKDYFLPNGQSPFLWNKPNLNLHELNLFGLNEAAMALEPMWFTCCITNKDVNWDVAALPSFGNAEPASVLFPTEIPLIIPKMAKDPQASFEVMSLFLGQYMPDLYRIFGYSGQNPPIGAHLLSRMSRQYLVLNTLRSQWPDVDWQVFIDALNYIDYPSVRNSMPNNTGAWDILGNFQWRYQTTPDLDIDAELDQLQQQLQEVNDLLNPAQLPT